MKKWLQQNHYIGILFVAFFIMGAYVFITDDKATYQNVEIQQGDTLWKLAEQYRGKMTAQEWIHKVKKENNLFGENIVAGSDLKVVIHEKSIYLSNLQKEEDLQSIEVAIKNQ